MPIPTRSRSQSRQLRQPGFSQTQDSGVEGAPGKAANASGNGDEGFDQSQNPQNKAGHHLNVAGKTTQSTAMAPPSQLKRVSSLRKPSRQSGLPSPGTMHPPRNPSKTNVPPTQTGNQNVSQPQVAPNGLSSGLLKPQSIDQGALKRSSTVQSQAKSRLSVHSRSQSTSGPTMAQSLQQIQNAAHTREVSASSHGTLLQPRPEVSSQGRDISDTVQVKPGKPQFSTYQQHFSPRRTPKISTSLHVRNIDQQQGSQIISAAKSIHAGAGDEGAASQAQILRLQDELLQLQLLHSQSHSQQKKYLENTMQKLKVRFVQLSRDHRALAAQEYAYKRESNCVALQQWLGEGELSGSGKLQTLAQCINEVATLTASNGMLCRAIEQFESWFESAILISNSRSSYTASPQHYDTFVGTLDQEWHELLAVLLRKLGSCARVLEALGPAEEHSSLAMVLATHKRFVDNLRQELEYTSTIEEFILQREQAWIEKSIVRIMHEDDPVPAEGQQDDHRRHRQEAWNVDLT